MVRNKVKVSSIVENQIPLFAREDYPFLQEFLKSYYDFLDSPGKPADILTNLESYKKLDFLTNYKSETTLVEPVSIFDTTITVNSTLGFPEENGVLKINEEIVHYQYKTDTTFEDCSRGFSEVTSYNDPENPDQMLFEPSSAGEHSSGDSVNNLNVLLLDEFFTKLKVQFCPGFENVELAEELNQSLFIKQVKDFYSSKGTDDSFVILFKALYGSSPKIIRPRDFLFTPSIADYRVTLDLTVEPIIGDPAQILSRVLYQDNDGDFDKAYGTVVGVKEFIKDENTYYTISLDYGYNRDLGVEGTVYGEFSIHPQTKTLENVAVGASVVTVDSTIGFAEDGQLLVIFNADPDTDNDDDYMLIEYTSINANQFLGVTGIDREIPEGWTLGVNTYIYSYDEEGEEVRMRVCGVLGQLQETSTTPYSEVGDSAVVWHVGKKSNIPQANTWIFNHAISNRVFELTDNGSLNYTITTYDNCYVNGGDKVILTCEVVNFDGSRETIEKEFECSSGPTPNNSFTIVNDRPITQAFYVKRQITKIKGTEIIANVQNTYLDQKNSVYVASNSLPNYFNQDLDIKYREIILRGTFNQETIVYQNHSFYTGDSVIFDDSYSENNNLNLSGIYFIYRIDQDTFKLAKSRPNIEQNIFIYVSGTSEYSKLIRVEYSDDISKRKELLPQNLIRKLVFEPQKPKIETTISPQERIGIFRNGVEALTYKTKDYCYYGEIDEVVITSNGLDYDVINPPILELLDSSGSGFSGEVIVEGNLRNVYIDDPGFDYIEDTISVEITGGNPITKASASVETQGKIHKVFFDTSRIDLTNNIINFSDNSPHRFREGDRVLYDSEGQDSVGGLENKTFYYVGVIDRLKIGLHETRDSALSLTDRIDLSVGGIGDHSLESDTPKNIISKIIVSDFGDGYSNNKAIVTSAGINTASYTITSKNHQFRENDIVVYSYTESPISGLSTSKTYIVSVIDDETFRLYEENTTEDGGKYKFRDLNQYVKISSTPSGYHTFSYPPIEIKINSKLGVSNKVESDCIAKFNPIFRGIVKKVEIKSGGINYGSKEILNYEKQPRYFLRTGEGAIVQPVLFNGKIKDTIILSGGRYYNSIPNVYAFESDPEVNPVSAILSPTIKDGKLDSIKVIDGGLDHSENVKIIVDAPGRGASLIFKIKSWNVNLVDRLIRENSISSDDGILVRSINPDYGLQYTHAYSPRNLRNTVYSQKLDEGILKYKTDLDSDSSSSYHSPILGWAYDGNPIYGPYGYDTPTGGRIRQIKSGYIRVTKQNRPDFPVGFFVEDYQYTQSGDLDEFNGRFCITPEFPNGTYAYFLTLESTVQKEGSFTQGKLPEFPYIIGPKYHSEPSPFNYQTNIDQGNFDFGLYGCRRNISPYNIKEWYSGYDYLIQPNKFDAHFSTITKINPSTIDEIQIISEGENYKVGDYVFFDNVGTGGTGLSARVSRVRGKNVTKLTSNENYIEGVKIYKSNFTTGLIGVCPEPHDVLGNDYIRLTGISTDSDIAIDSVEKVRIPSPLFTLGANIENSTSTGLVTYLKISSGSLDFPIIYENDILQINDEKLKVLNVEKDSLRVRVLREQYQTVGSAHSVTDVITIIPRKFFVDGYSLEGLKTNISKIDREFYFNPQESVGVGLTYGSGITTTIYFSNPGLGLTFARIPTRSIYIKNHQLEDGDVVTYNSNGGGPLSVSVDSIEVYDLENNTDLYVVKYNNDAIGLSTVKLGISSITDDNKFVGLGTNYNANPLYFVGVGTGTYHSLKTNYDHISSELFQSTITVETSQDSELIKGDNVVVDITESGITTYKVFYNDANRRMVIDSLEITNVDVLNNQIFIENHGLVDGDKVIYRENTTLIGGLQYDKIYYAIYINKDKIELSENYTESQFANGTRINLTSVGNGFLYKVNPKLIPVRNNTIIFDLSDPSLSYVDGTNRITAFDFKLFYDKSLKNEYLTNETSGQFNISYNGSVGISTNAKLTLKVDESTPNELYYNLVPRKVIGLPSVKSSIFRDNLDINDANKIQFSFLRISTVQNVVSSSSTSFTFKTTEELPKKSYTVSDASIKYTTTSSNAKGPVFDVRIENYGNGYTSLVGITSIVSKTGVGARVKTKGTSIGASKEFKIDDVGWDYPTDVTLYPTAKLPDSVEVDQLFSFDTITTTNPGYNYTILPNIIVKDSVTSEILTDLILTNKRTGIEIIKNTNRLSNDSPIFIPTNNPNGYSIKNIVFDVVTKDVTLTFKNSFSDISNFPFAVGDEILIEGCASKTTGSKNRTFNSSDFSYTLFEITEIDPNIGGSNATLKFNLINLVSFDETLGEYDTLTSTGIVVPKKFFPEYKATVKKNSFISGELVKGLTSKVVSEVQSWDSDNEILKVLGPSQFNIGEYIEGENSGTIAYVNNINVSEMYYEITSGVSVQKGWTDEKGFLNNNFQKVQDSFYWQKFSYAIQSQISENVWEDSVERLNHLTGWKRFSDHIIESKDLNNIGITTDQNSGDFVSIADLSREVDLNCVFDFDIVLDETSLIGSKRISNGIIFNSKELQDYENSIGNRVLVIDDISDQFNNRPRANPFSIVTTFKLADVRSRKLLVFARDKRFTGERQVYLVTFIHNGQNIYINQYGRVETADILGSFDVDIYEDEGRLLFYPRKFRVNNYDLSLVSYDVKDYISGIGNTYFGDIVKVDSNFIFRSSGITTTIASIPLDYRASKLLVQIEDTQNIYEYDEITVLHDGQNVEIIDYGQLTTDSIGLGSSTGIGTYYAYISGSNLNIDLIPDFPYDADINVLTVSIASSESGFINSGISTLNTTEIRSFYTGIGTTTSTSPTKIAQFENGLLKYSGGYFIVSIEDTTNSRYQVSEITLVTDDNDAYYSEFGLLYNDSEVGIITAGVNGSFTELYFTADSEIDAEVRVFANSIGLVDTFNTNNEISLTNSRIYSDYGTYEGTESAIRKDFELYHKGNPIFQKKFNASDSNIVKIDDNLLELPLHFFVTGEKVFYTYGIQNEPIGIATTTISGIGLTDKLPNELYVIKEDNLNVRFAASAADALNLVPIPLVLTSVGVGSDQYITAQKQNTKALITIDNMIQSPIVSTSTTSLLSSDLLITDDVIFLTENTNFFFGGDLIKINDEIMRVSIVGYGVSNAIFVQRPWLGTSLSTHSAGDLITKVVGNYNIVNNTLSFAEAPYGKYPIGIPENAPDERDYTGITTHSTFSGRTFMRSGITDTIIEPYTSNVIFDGIQDQFTGFASSFDLKVNGSDVTGIVNSNAIITISDIFQSPRVLGNVIDIEGNYYLEEDEILEKTTIYFEDNEYSGTDPLVRGIPVGGRIVSVGSTKGFGYQPLISAGGTAVVSSAGTIQSISITNPGSGYRSGVQTVYVGVQTSSDPSSGIQTCIGLASISYGRIDSVQIINPGSGYTHSNPPLVVFDSPLSYTNIPLEYSQTSIGKTTGINATVDVVVGQGSSVIDFEFVNNGIAYGINNVLTVSTGGTTGIPREYRGRYIDAANLIAVNKEFIKNEVIGFVTTTYPTITSNPDYDETKCKRDIGYIVDAISKDLAFGGNYYSVQSGLSYWNSGTNYVDGELTETIAAYEYIAGISSYLINNISVPVSYQVAISSISQIKNLSIDYDATCNPSSYDSNCCADVTSSISNYVGIVTTIIGFGTDYSPVVQSPVSQPTLTLPTTQQFENFEITVESTYNNEFTGWTIGDLQVIDDISDLFDGFKTKFPIRFDGIRKSIKSSAGSLIDVQSTLLVFMNDILQVPGQGYIFKGGSVIRFSEAPKEGDKCKIIFYRGTGSVDVEEVDILETVSPGDILTIHSDIPILTQDERSVKDVTSTDAVETFPYGGRGISDNESLERPVNWCRKNVDLVVDGIEITKNRELYEAQITPFTNIIYDVGIGDTTIYVESVKTFFDNKKENATEKYTNTIDIVSQDLVEECIAVANVNSLGIVTSITVIEEGSGYTSLPTVSIGNPKIGTDKATATANLSSGRIVSINVVNSGSGYDINNPPPVLVSPPLSKGEVGYKVNYEGDFGFVTGIGTTSVGLSSVGLVLEFSIPEDSPLKDESVVEDPYRYSGISTGDYFTIKDTSIGFGITSVELDGSILVYGKEYLDNVYQVHDIITDLPSIIFSDDFVASLTRYGSYSIGLGASTTVADGATLIVEDFTKIVTVVQDYNNLGITSFLTRSFFGEYSYGKIKNVARPYPEEYSIYRDNGLLGIATSPIVRRTNALKSINYIT